MIASTPESLLVLRATPRRVSRWLLIVVFGLLAAGTLARVALLMLDDSYAALHELARRFDLDFESNVPTWYSSMGLLIAAGILAIIARAKWHLRAPFRGHWAVLAIVFVGLSIDEAVQLHELLRGPMHKRWELHGLLHFAWLVPAAGAVAVFGLAYWRFLAHLTPRTRSLFLGAAALFAGAVLGLEALGGAQVERTGYESLAYAILMVCEEGAEILGVALFIYALLDYLRTDLRHVRIAFGDDPSYARRDVVQREA